MYQSNLENALIATDIGDLMIDYVAIQPDLDETKIKASAIVAQKVDLGKVIGNKNIQRCINPVTENDNKLRELIIAPLCYFTHARLIKMFQGYYTESGYVVEGEAEKASIVKSIANESMSVGESFLEGVLEFLEKEKPQTQEVDRTQITNRIRVFGGKENR